MKNTQNTIPPQAQSLFDSLENLRVTPETGEGAMVERVLSHVPVRKPAKEWFFRIHPEHRLDALVLELKEDGETLLILPALQSALMGEKCVVYRSLRLGVNRQGNAFVWALRPPMEGKRDAWATTALDAATMAEDRWVRMQADMNLGGYQLAVAKVESEPVWPNEPFNEILRVAFKGAVVESLDHPTLKRLRGEA